MASDAQILLDDALRLMEEQGFNQRTLAMLQSCEAVELAEDTLAVSTRAGFVKKTLESDQTQIEELLSQAAFMPIHLEIQLNREPAAPAEATSTMSEAEVEALTQRAQPKASPAPVAAPAPEPADERTLLERVEARKRANPLVEHSAEYDSELTFETFVEGEENRIALQAAKQVADGDKTGFNPLFIYGRPGLGKTHLLKAIQNYIDRNDPTRICVYKQSHEFLDDYMTAMRNPEDRSGAAATLEANYRDIDVLIIDDIQQLSSAQRTIDFFFNIFNYLHDHGRQIIIAADRTPQELGTQLNFDERVTSRVGGGFQVGIEVPAYELKISLIQAFLQRMREEAAAEGRMEAAGEIPRELIEYMAEKSGSNIRTIKAFCLSCLFKAADLQAQGEQITKQDINRIAKERFPINNHIVTIEEIQEAVEEEFAISHEDLVGSKRNKELMIPRHIGIYLCRSLTDSTLAEIGLNFGNRSHGTVKHSLQWVEEAIEEDLMLKDRIARMKETILD